ncbi:MAG: hypothetical protein IT318_21685 [Anaerolineales bacterium]|nr:hypothetical protein [Anaerolineales bacterium]
MPTLPPLTCANCGAALATTAPPGTTLTCGYCGTPMRVPAPERSEPGPASEAELSSAAPTPEPQPEPEPIVVPPERITVIPAQADARSWASRGNRARFWLLMVLFLLACCGLPLATALLCLASGWGGDLDLR